MDDERVHILIAASTLALLSLLAYISIGAVL